MFCPRCGVENSNQRKLCSNCGTNIEWHTQALLSALPPAQSALPLDLVARHRSLRRGVLLTSFGVGLTLSLGIFFAALGAFSELPFLTTLGGIGLIPLCVGLGTIINARYFSAEMTIQESPPPPLRAPTPRAPSPPVTQSLPFRVAVVNSNRLARAANGHTQRARYTWSAP